MKTLDDILHEETSIRSQYVNGLSINASKREESAANRKLTLLKECRLYLETNPRIDFIKDMLNESTRKLNLIKEGYFVWIKNNTHFKNPKPKYENEMGVKKVKLEIATLKYILS